MIKPLLTIIICFILLIAITIVFTYVLVSDYKKAKAGGKSIFWKSGKSKRKTK